MIKTILRKTAVSGVLAGSFVFTALLYSQTFPEAEVIADAGAPAVYSPAITEEITAERGRFTKQFAMSDGSFTAAAYSMPVHYKKNGKWKEIDTTLVKSGKKNYRTKATDLKIRVARKAGKKATAALERGKTGVSFALTGRKFKPSKAKTDNPEKKIPTDVLNQNRVQYKNVLKNTDISYDIFPEKLQETISVTKKQKRKSFVIKISKKGLKVKVKGKKVYFKTKKGKTKYTRLTPTITDAYGVSTTKLKVTYNKKKKTLKVTPDKKWWNSKKRKFPVEIRTTYITDSHTRDVKVGAAYAGSPDKNFGYDKSLLLQAGKCVAFTKMTDLAGIQQKDAKILDAALHIRSEKTLRMGAGKLFDIGVHKVTQNWSARKLTYNNRPVYEEGASVSFGIQKKGDYTCDVTDVVKAWQSGEANCGVALAADNSNRSYQARLDRNPYFTVHYETVGFDGAARLREGGDITRDVLAAGQENYYYFETKPGIAYDLYTTSALDTQGILYDEDKNRLDYDDNSGLNDNFCFTKSYDGRRYLKVNVKGSATGKYTLSLKKRFVVPEPVGRRKEDSYIISWSPVEHATEYLITVYDSRGKISEAVTGGTSYEYVFTGDTVGKTLAFTVTPRENESLAGEHSRKIYSDNTESEWKYGAPMTERRENFASAVCGGKIYVLGGEDRETKTTFRSLEVYDPEKQTWERAGDYPGDVPGICNARMAALKGKLYVIGGQTETGVNARLLKEVWSYDPDSGRWEALADLPEGRTDMPVTVCDGKIYVFAKVGTEERVDVYDPAADRWTSDVRAGTSVNLQARTIDGKIFVLREKEPEDGDLPAKMYWEEYLPESGEYDNAGTVCDFANAGQYRSGAVVNSKIYMVNDKSADRALCYDVYLDKWSRVSVFNLEKGASQIQSVGNVLYSLGGTLEGFGTADVTEIYELDIKQITKQMDVTEGEPYELQVRAANCEEDTDYLVTVRTDPSALEYAGTSSFMRREKIEKGRGGIQLMRYMPKKGVMILKLRGKMETGDTGQAYQSIPVTGVKDGVTAVSMQIEKG